MKIALYGFMGAGKTSLGSILAKRLGALFIDLDVEIEKHTGMNIVEYFEQYGETEFRKIEHKVLKDIIKKDEDNIILSLGGGTILQPSNRKILKLMHFKNVYLDIKLPILISRLKEQKEGRPIIKNIPDKEFPLFIEALLSSRKPIYEKAADLHIKINQEGFKQAVEKVSLLLNLN
jgi:shikimate kinase